MWSLEIEDEVEVYARAFADKPGKVEEARFWGAYSKINSSYGRPAAIKAALESFEARYPEAKNLVKLYETAYNRLHNNPAQDQIFEEMKEKFPHSSVVQQKMSLREQEAYFESLKGKPFRLSFEDLLSGRSMSISDLRGKVVIVDFWATGCGPCVAEIPHLIEIYSRYKARGVEILGISLDSDPAYIKEYAEENNMRRTHARNLLVVIALNRFFLE